MARILILLFCSTVFCVIQLNGETATQGYVIGWGNNRFGAATGVIERGYSTGTVMVTGQMLSNVIAVSAGKYHGLALLNNGTVIGWGNNMSGRAVGSETGGTNGLVRVDGQVLTNVAAVSAFQFSVALKQNGTVTVWGHSGSGPEIQVPKNLTNAVALSSGEDCCLVLKKDGTLVRLAAGGATPTSTSNVIAFAAGRSDGFRSRGGSDFALRSDGKVVCLDANPFEENLLPNELTNIATIVSSGAVKLALLRDGRVFGWGTNDRGQATGVRTTNFAARGFVTINGRLLSGVTAIASGRDASLALKRDGTIVGWGRAGVGSEATIPEGLSNVVAIAAGPDYCLAITTNRTVAERFMPTQ